MKSLHISYALALALTSSFLGASDTPPVTQEVTVTEYYTNLRACIDTALKLPSSTETEVSTQALAITNCRLDTPFPTSFNTGCTQCITQETALVNKLSPLFTQKNMSCLTGTTNIQATQSCQAYVRQAFPTPQQTAITQVQTLCKETYKDCTTTTVQPSTSTTSTSSTTTNPVILPK